MKKTIFAILAVFLFQGCAGLVTNEEVAQLEKQLKPVDAPKAEVAGAEAAVKAQAAEQGSNEEAAVAGDDEPLTRYSELNNMAPPSDRQYKRMTRKRMEEESELYSSAGSLWRMEGQTSYLFAENKRRREGDPTNIKMEGAALKQVENKVSVISDLLKQLEEQKVKAEEDEKKAAEEKVRLAQIEEEKKLRAERIARGEIVVDPMEEQDAAFMAAAETDKTKADDKRKPASVAENKKAKEEKIDLKDIESIPSKIVEKLSDDTYRIRGQQYLTIKKKPYRVIATAVVRAEDFNDNGISSNKLLDAQFEVIHMKRTAE